MPDNPGDVFADSGYRGKHFASAVIAKGGTPLVVQTSTWGHPGDDSVERLRRWNTDIQKVRCRIEDIRDVEAILRAAPHAMARIGKCRPPGPTNRHCLQPQTNLNDHLYAALITDNIPK